MVQVFDMTPTPSSASMIGSALAQGMSKNFQDPQQRVQQGILSQAMQNLPENASYMDVLKTIGPQLLTTPGGSQLLAEMGPILQKQSQSAAYLEYLKQNPQNVIGAGGAGTSSQGGGMGSPSQAEVSPSGEAYFKNPKPPVGKEGTYPKMSALPEPVPIMTPQEMQHRAQHLIASSVAQGQPADPIAVQNIIQAEQNQRMMYNQNIEKERGIREGKQQEQSKRMLQRFDNSHPNSTPEDQVVFEKFANEAKDAANENDTYTYARTKYNEYENAKNGLIREADIPGFAEKMWSQAMGTYKSKERVIKDLQPHLKKLKDLGLENEARAILSNDVGLGMEDTELALFPPSKKENAMFNKLPQNPQQKKVQNLFTDDYLRFPGEESALDNNGFMKFKEEIAGILEKNPETNLVAMRGVLNSDKKYAWTDISKAVAELIDEGRFKPNNIQEQQWNVVKSPPIPGMGAMFRDFWKGTR